MSSDHLINIPRKHLVEYQIPKQIYTDLYDRLDRAEFLFIPLIMKDNKPKIYFEKNADHKGPAICRLFWRASDVKLYVKHLNNIGDHDGEVVGWEASPESIINSVIVAWNKLPGLSIDVIASVFYDNEFRDVERFWSSNESFMV